MDDAIKVYDVRLRVVVRDRREGPPSTWNFPVLLECEPEDVKLIECAQVGTLCSTCGHLQKGN